MIKKKICILTATRAEFGLLKPIIHKLNNVPEFDIHVVVTGAHMSPEFGLTYKEVENEGVHVDKKIEMLLSADTPSAISKSMGIAMISFADYFNTLQPDLLLVLGDRYETLAVSIVAANQRIPIAHLYGGETTEGAIDESIRHAITKLSFLHFTSTEEYRNRVIQLGEHPNRVFTVGAIGIENILNHKMISRVELEEAIDFKLDKNTAMIIFHPVTLEENNSAEQFEELLKVCDSLKDWKFIFSKANADANGRIINHMIDRYVKNKPNAVSFTSLDMKKYLSVLNYCSLFIGNSSSGLIEVPSFNIPTINIGDRQRGRLKAKSVINCEPISESINAAIKKALSKEFLEEIKKNVNPYGDGNSSSKIVEIIKDFMLTKEINLKKQFYDIEVE